MFAVCAGLHQLSTIANGARVDTNITLHPRESRSFEFDAVAGRWHEHAGAADAACVSTALSSPLFDYNDNVAGYLMQNPAKESAAEALSSAQGWLAHALAACDKGHQEQAHELAARARTALIGAPLASLAPISNDIGFQTFDLSARGHAAQALAVLAVGLAVIPDSPALLAALGELQMAADPALGHALLTRAASPLEVALTARDLYPATMDDNRKPRMFKTRATLFGLLGVIVVASVGYILFTEGRSLREVWLEACYKNPNYELRRANDGAYECHRHDDPCAEGIATNAGDMQVRCATRPGCVYDSEACVCYPQIFGRGVCVCGGGKPQACRSASAIRH